MQVRREKELSLSFRIRFSRRERADPCDSFKHALHSDGINNLVSKTTCMRHVDVSTIISILISAYRIQ